MCSVKSIGLLGKLYAYISLIERVIKIEENVGKGERKVLKDMLQQNEGVNNKSRRHAESRGFQFRECPLESSDHPGKTGTG